MNIGHLKWHKFLITCAAVFLIAAVFSVDSAVSRPVFNEGAIASLESFPDSSDGASSVLPTDSQTDSPTDLPSDAPTDAAVTTQPLPSRSASRSSIVTSLSSQAAPVDPQSPYWQLYPDLYCEKPQESIKQDKTVYLTFDDGPSRQTPKVLDILKENDVKATFFVVGRSDEDSRALMKRIVDEGHTIGLHSYSHNYKKVYQSVTAFLDDYNALNTLVYEATGVKPTIFRFPGGSINDFDRNVYPAITAEMKRRGYTYFDWNVSSGDTDPKSTPDSIYHNIVDHASKNSRSIVLMHDSAPKTAVVSALDGIIKELKRQGYTFSSLSNDVRPIVF